MRRGRRRRRRMGMVMVVAVMRTTGRRKRTSSSIRNRTKWEIGIGPRTLRTMRTLGTSITRVGVVQGIEERKKAHYRLVVIKTNKRLWGW